MWYLVKSVLHVICFIFSSNSSLKNVIRDNFSAIYILCHKKCYFLSLLQTTCKSRKATPQKLTQLSSRSHPRHLVGLRRAQKDITIDTTSDSQVNSNFPNRWSPASLTFNNYFYLLLYIFIFIYNVNNLFYCRNFGFSFIYFTIVKNG